MAFITSNAVVDDVFATWINKTFISDLMYSLQHQKFTTKAEVPKGGGFNIARFVDFAPPTIQTGYSGAGATAITEASTTAHEITSVTTNPTNITLAEYGEFLKVGELYEYAAIEGTRAKLRKRLLDAALLSVDEVVRSTAHGTTSSIFATAVQAGGVTTGPSAITALGATTLMLAKKTLYANLATGFSGIPGHPDGQVATILTPLQELDVTTEVTTLRSYWTNIVVNVPGAMGQEKAVKGYIGSVYGNAVYVTQQFVTVSYTAAAQIGYAYGDGGVAAASFGDMKPEIIFNDVNSPYKNVNSIAWHLYFGAGLVSSLRVLKIYSSGA